jgi:hypothetical protein
VLAAVPTPRNCNFCGETMGNTDFERQRVIGYGDVRADGSFSIEVPANTPMHVQTLDEDGLMLVNQLQWINVMPGERRLCTGCHGVREKDRDIELFKTNDTTGEVTFSIGRAAAYLSGFHNAQKVTEHPSARPEFVNFATLKEPALPVKTADIQTILDKRCNSCHGAAAAAAQGGGLVLEADADTAFINHGTTNVYETLTSGNRYLTGVDARKINYATDNGARQSPLAWVLFHKQMGGAKGQFRIPSYDHSAIWEKDSTGRPDVFAKVNADLLMLIEWMDMGVQFMNTVPK